METHAVVLEGPKGLSVQAVPLVPAAATDVVAEIRTSGISTGTEKLLWSGEMPFFPGMGYPLVPGYEAMGEIVETPPGSLLRSGDQVFVPGATCFGEVKGLFGAAARRVAVPAERLIPLEPGTGPDGALLALAATARHALAANPQGLPDLIVGHGVLGRLLARLTILMAGAPPTVWETQPLRREGSFDYPVIDPEDDPRRDYGYIYDASGDAGLLDALIGRLAKGGEIVLAGFYAQPIQFAFPPAFMREARLRIAAEWARDDMDAIVALLGTGMLRLDDLITHTAPAADAVQAYQTAFTDPACLKMILDWEGFA